MLFGPGVSIVDLTVGPLSIPLREPFVIASGRMDATRAALVRATLEDGGGRRATGFGESAALPPVTRRDIDAVEDEARRAHPRARRQEAQDGAADQRFPRTRSADDAEPLASQGEAHAAHRLLRAEADIEVRDLEKRAAHPCRGSSISRSPSPNRLKPRLATAMARPGAAAIHH